MRKKVSKRKEQERKILRTYAKRHSYTILLSSIVPLLVTVAMLITYAVTKYVYLWLCAACAVSWIALGALFIFAHVKKWGYVTKKGVESSENFSVVTIYNIVLIFALAILFTVLFIAKAF